MMVSLQCEDLRNREVQLKSRSVSEEVHSLDLHRDQKVVRGKGERGEERFMSIQRFLERRRTKGIVFALRRGVESELAVS